MKRIALGLKVRVVSRGKGETALDRAAYQLGGNHAIATATRRVRTLPQGQHFRTLVFLPEGAPAWAKDPERLWIEAAAVERQFDAQEARVLDVQIPRDVPVQYYSGLASAVYGPFARSGLPVQVDIHIEVASDGKPNPNMHGLLGMRGFKQGGFSKTKNEYRHWNDYFRKWEGKWIRTVIAQRINDFCRDHGIEVEVDPRSNSERGLPDPEPQVSRAVHRRPEFASSKKIIEMLKERRKVRAEYDSCDEAIEKARAARLAARAEVLAHEQRRVRLEAGKVRYHDRDFVDACLDWREFEFFAWQKNVKISELGCNNVLIEIDETEIVIQECTMVVDGPITERVLETIGSLSSDLKWQKCSVEGPVSPADRRAMWRTLRSYARTDPVQFHLASLESTDAYMAIASAQEQGDPWRFEEMGVPQKTYAVVKRALMGDFDKFDIDICEIPALARAAFAYSLCTSPVQYRPISDLHDAGLENSVGSIAIE